jgi:hypothetical protein
MSDRKAADARYNASDEGRARRMAYSLRRESDQTPVYEVRDKWGDLHVVTKGTLYKIAERQRKDKAARRSESQRGRRRSQCGRRHSTHGLPKGGRRRERSVHAGADGGGRLP